MPRKKQEKSEEKAEENSEVKEKSSKISQEEFEKKVMELAETGLTSEKIGEKLRKEGIHSAEFSKKISQILGGKFEPPEIKNVEKKLRAIEAHSAKNKGDKRALREKARVAAQLRRLRKYFNK
jgi:ribosomal protein S15P/S13E